MTHDKPDPTNHLGVGLAGPTVGTNNLVLMFKSGTLFSNTPSVVLDGEFTVAQLQFIINELQAPGDI